MRWMEDSLSGQRVYGSRAIATELLYVYIGGLQIRLQKAFMVLELLTDVTS